MYCHGASELEHNRLTQFNLSALSKRVKSFLSKPPTVFCLIRVDFFIYNKYAIGMYGRMLTPIVCSTNLYCVWSVLTTSVMQDSPIWPYRPARLIKLIITPSRQTRQTVPGICRELGELAFSAQRATLGWSTCWFISQRANLHLISYPPRIIFWSFLKTNNTLHISPGG